jgi:hypothetical protein
MYSRNQRHARLPRSAPFSGYPWPAGMLLWVPRKRPVAHLSSLQADRRADRPDGSGRGELAGNRCLADHQLRIITVGQADTYPSTIVHIPSLAAVIAGDVAYNGIHQWLLRTDHDKRMQWIASVEQVEALKPKIVVASHKRPDAHDDAPATILGDTKTYIRDFDQALAESRSAQELVDKMMVLHGDLGNPYTLWTAAQGVFEQGQGASP